MDWYYLTLLFPILANISPLLVLGSVEPSFCKDANVMCFGSKNNVPSWSQDDGCIRDRNCEILLTGAVLSDGKVEWQIESPFNLSSKNSYTLLFSISEHPSGFDPKTNYIGVNVTRFLKDSHIAYSFINSVDKRGKAVKFECPANNKMYSCFEDYGEANTARITSVILKSSEIVWYQLDEWNYNPYVNFKNYQLFIHLRLETKKRQGKTLVIENVSSLGHFKLFDVKSSENNPNNPYDPSIPWTVNPGGTYSLTSPMPPGGGGGAGGGPDGGGGGPDGGGGGPDGGGGGPDGGGDGPGSDGGAGGGLDGNGTGISTTPSGKLPESDATTKPEEKKSSKTLIIIIVVVVMIVAIAALIACLYFMRRKKGSHKKHSKSNGKGKIKRTQSKGTRSDVRSQMSGK